MNNVQAPRGPGAPLLPAQERDRLEALSHKYSNRVVIILPLRSTNWAIFNARRELCAIVPAGQVQQAVLAVTAQNLASIPLPGTFEWAGARRRQEGDKKETRTSACERKLNPPINPIDLSELDL